MATYTTNLNLKKPATSDKIRIADFNNNADLIDAGYADQDTSLGKLGGGMAIISTGNVHAAISAGQFVYVRKHGTLTEGLYTADSNISANATLSASNLTAVSGGGLNALNGNLAVKDVSNNFPFNASLSDTSAIIVHMSGKTVAMEQFSFSVTSNVSAWGSIATIASGYRPPTNIFVPFIAGGTGYLQFTPQGSVLTSIALSTGTTYRTASATWMA